MVLFCLKGGELGFKVVLGIEGGGTNKYCESPKKVRPKKRLLPLRSDKNYEGPSDLHIDVKRSTLSNDPMGDWGNAAGREETKILSKGRGGGVKGSTRVGARLLSGLVIDCLAEKQTENNTGLDKKGEVQK